jgi:pyrroloquinoline-quinone synthase
METHTAKRRGMSAVEDLMKRRSILSNPYFTGLREGTFERLLFIRTQLQFFHAVRFFPRPMAALMSRLPNSETRRGLLHNLAEEHGLDDETGGIRAAMAHDKTFAAFLGTLGVDADAVALEPEGHGVRAFNLALLGACMTEPPPFAFASLGIIEYAFADISALIGEAVVKHGWIAPEKLVHYKLHALIDKQHAAEFLTSAECTCRSGGLPMNLIEDGLEFGLHIFDQLYASMLASK